MKKSRSEHSYDPAKIEKKWQKKWARSKIYASTEKSKETKKQKYYVLDMFPYPSGEGLHVGHPKGYIATDVISRMKRMQGHNVLHPMGFDAFGLPAENYAIKTKTNPADAVKKNVERYKKQLELLGFDYDWSREVNTTDPAYYRWTQWIFLQLFKKGLAYESNEPVNWCPTDKTVLANEDVENGRCERCGTPVEKKPMRQWVLRITDYADRLLDDLDASDYVMPKLVDRANPHQPGKPLVKREVAHAIVYDPRNKRYLIIRNKKHGWDTIIIGGIENGESPEETARREVREETGYTDIEFKRFLGGKTEAHYYAKHKGENRIAFAQAVYFELNSDTRVPIADGEDKDDEVLWIEAKDFVPGKMVNSEMSLWLERIKNPDAGWPKPLLDWPESIKESQRNWIGRSEGALIKFPISNSQFPNKSQSSNSKLQIEVFTTRPDTLFGVTYVVLAPEHKLVQELLAGVSNKAEVEAYISKASRETEIERTDVSKEKTGVELKGIKAINPANKEEVPVWIADYVLADYGTGAVMAVPAHDDRDWEFAKKFGLPIRHVIAEERKATTTDIAFRENESVVNRDVIRAVVKHWSDDKYLVLKWNEHGWKTFISGGIDNGENPVDAARREITEETGYKNIEFVREIGGPVRALFYAPHKKQNRIDIQQGLLFRLKDGDQDPVSEDERSIHSAEWVPVDEVDQIFNATLVDQVLLQRINNDKVSAFTDNGVLIHSNQFDGKSSESVKKEITDFVGGRWVTKYKLRDWVFSRQRYWGEPIPLIHCDKCGVVAVPEKDLPVKLPKVDSYEPTGTGESPLAAISKWVNVKCPKCGGKGRRETNTMPQWAGSCWYYLRYMDPKNKKALVDSTKEKYWSPVDLYVGGAEHATRHLIYARFWHKFLKDIGVVSTTEPFIRLQSVGLIMGEDGRKMSKRFGNVVNPDEIVERFGADTMRIYEMFMGPFEQSIAWSTDSMVGARRFIERVWKLLEKVISRKSEVGIETKNNEASRILHKTIKKVSEDISDMRFNTAVSTLMICVNELEKAEQIDKTDLESLLKLLAPFAPHVTEELWARLGNKESIHISEWPEYDPALIGDEELTIIVQVNGKTRGSFTVPSGTESEELEKRAKDAPPIKKWLEGKTVRKIITVPGRLVNIVLTD